MTKPDEKEAENIRVAVRCRPMNEREIREQAVSCFTSENGNAVLTNLENSSEKHEFGYDFVYGCDSLQETVFQDIGVPILDRAFGGYNGTIFAYGQTGSGKTFSMSGVSGNESLEGLIPRMNKTIFERIKVEKGQDPNKLFLVECSFFEIYNEIIYDLLDSSGNGKKNKGGLEIKEHSVLGIYVKDLQERVVESREEVIELMAQGAQARTVGYTQMNSESSRSHSIFTIKIHQKDSTDESKNIFAKINLVDLAGSERAASTGAQGDRLKEGANINKSLSALGNVINALVEASRMGKKVFIPYRNSKLTRVLQESLGGNSLCSMLATLSPANINFPETLSTLKYASRAKSIKVNAKKNEASSQISQLNEEIAALKKKLMEQTEVTLGLDPKEKEEIVKAYEKQIQEMDRIRLQTWEDKAKLSKQHELERKRLAKERAIADQKIREERTRKWKLLEEKGDIELMLRALRDLDRSPAGATGATGCSSIEEKWLEMAAKLKSLESESKDHRTLIMVFKDSLHKDVEQWAKRFQVDTKGGSKRDDSAAVHMTASQLCNKLQNIHQESAQLMALEKSLIVESNSLINDMMSELIRFREHRAKLKATTSVSKPQATTAPGAAAAKPAANAAKEVEQVMEEREKGLGITLALVQMQRAKIVAFVKSERKRVYNFSEVTTQFMKYIDAQIATISVSPSAQVKPERQQVQSPQSAGVWQDTKKKLLAIAEKWDKYWTTEEMQAKKSSGDDSLASYVPKGEIVPLGMESKLIYDENLVVSSRKPDAKNTRMNSSQYWIPDNQDQAPSLLVDFELPRFFQSIAIKGGCFNGTTGVPHSSSSVGGKNGSRESKQGGEATATPSTFVLKDTTSLQAELVKYKLSEVSGEHEPTYKILSNVMSWVDLLKTTVIPAKLFTRPPVRFLHDIISAVIQNTGYASELFNDTEKDYSLINTKTERADYLTKILDYVQATYHKKHESSGGAEPSVIIAATASNILSGKEAPDTLRFLNFFSLAAIEHAIRHPPPPRTIVPSEPTKSAPPEPAREDSNSAGGGEACATSRSTGGDNLSKPEQQPEIAAPPASEEKKLRDCWVKKIRVTTSLNGKDWHALGEFEANTDAENVKTITFDNNNRHVHTGIVGRFIKLTCTEWQDLPLLQVEFFGQEASESDALVKAMEALGQNAIALLQQLLETASLLLEEAKVSWEKAKDVEREKQEELTNLGEEIKKVKQKCATLETEVKKLHQSQTQLQQNLQNEVKKLSEEKTRNEKLHKEVQQGVATIDEMKKKNESLEVKIGEQNHIIQTLTLQQSEQKKLMASLDQSKLDLEKLCGNLQAQLQNRDQQEGHQESKIASMYGELMAANVQVEEFKRKFETSEQMRKEQEAFGAQLHSQLQQNRVLTSEKEKAMEDSLKEKRKEFDETLKTLHTEKEELKRSLEQVNTKEAASQASVIELEEQVKTMRDEIDGWKRRLKEVETNMLAAAEATAANEAAASIEAGEKLMLEAQTKELRCLAEMEKMEAKVQAYELKEKEIEVKLLESKQERQSLTQRIAALEEIEEEMQLQLQVVTEERDSARQKEEQLFTENNEKEQEIERIRDGYVWVTDRMNSKEDELSELQEQIEKYQSLLEITTSGSVASKKNENAETDAANLKKLYALAYGTERGNDALEKSEELMKELTTWIETVKRASSGDNPKSRPGTADKMVAAPAKPIKNADAPSSTQANAKTKQGSTPTSEPQTNKAAVMSEPQGISTEPQPSQSSSSSSQQRPKPTETAVTMVNLTPTTPRSTTSTLNGEPTTSRNSLVEDLMPSTMSRHSILDPTLPVVVASKEDETEYDDDFDQDDNDETKKAQRKSAKAVTT